MTTTARERALNASREASRHARRRRYDKVLTEIEAAETIEKVTAERMARILRACGYTVTSGS